MSAKIIPFPGRFVKPVNAEWLVVWTDSRGVNHQSFLFADSVAAIKELLPEGSFLFECVKLSVRK